MRLNLPMLVSFLSLARAELANDVALRAPAFEHVLVRDEPLEPDGSPCVNASGADPDLRAEAIAEAVREARTRIHERARRVDPAAECRCRRAVLSDDAVGVVRGVRVDEAHRVRERGRRAHGEREREVLGRVRVWRRWVHVCGEVGERMGKRGEGRERGRVAEQLDVGCKEGLRYCRPDGREEAFMNDERFCCIARGGIVCLRQGIRSWL